MRIRIRRNPQRDYTETQKLDLRRADTMKVKARIFELGVSKFLKDGCGIDGEATRTAAEILIEATAVRLESEEIYIRIRREADAAAEPQPEPEEPTDR